MRRAACEITDPAKIDAVLKEATIGRMATNGSDGYPYIVPVNFVQMDGKIYFHCAPKGQKLDDIARDPKVCFQVDIPLAYLDTRFAPERAADRMHQYYHCVIIKGDARVVPDGRLKVDALNALIEKHEPDDGYQKVYEEMPAVKACAVVEITPVTVSAKSDLAQNRSEEDRLTLARYLNSRELPGDRKTVEAMGFDPDAI